MQRALLRNGLLFFCAVFSFAQESSGANSGDLFFLDLGIIIEPATGKEKYSRIIDVPAKEVKLRIKKTKSGSVYMAAPKEILESLKQINEKMEALEKTFEKKIDLVYAENEKIKNKLKNLEEPFLKKPERPKTVDDPTYGYDSEMLGDLYTKKKVFPPKIPRPATNVQPEKDFDHGTYMSGVFSYQRGNFKEALKLFSSLGFSGANQKTIENTLYWMADCLLSQGDQKSAIIMLDKLLNIESPTRAADALVQKGLIYRQQGEEGLAMDMFKDLIEEHPESDYAKLMIMEINKLEAYQ